MRHAAKFPQSTLEMNLGSRTAAFSVSIPVVKLTVNLRQSLESVKRRGELREKSLRIDKAEIAGGGKTCEVKTDVCRRSAVRRPLCREKLNVVRRQEALVFVYTLGKETPDVVGVAPEYVVTVRCVGFFYAAHDLYRA